MDEDDFEEDEEERQTWVEALTQELADDDAPEDDPDYEVGEVAHIQNKIGASCSLPKGANKIF